MDSQLHFALEDCTTSTSTAGVGTTTTTATNDEQ
jgi:hypothetical protein